jgi:hypothetical protein
MTRRGCLWAIVKPLLVLSLVGALLTVAAFPWAIPLPGRNSLSGSWIGELHSNSGPEAWLLLSLQPSRNYRPRFFGFLTGAGTPLGGSAVLCTGARRLDLAVTGGTTVWSGKTLDVLLRPVQPRPAPLRIQIVGTWDGHTLEFTQRNVSLADILSESGNVGMEAEGSKFVSSRLRKGTQAEFDSVCRGLAQV